MTPDGNPFSTCFVRPGQLEYAFAEGTTARQLVERLAAHKWWAAIVGPHGVGKSTLLHALLPELAAAGREVSAWTLPSGQRHWPHAMVQASRAWHAATQVVVDGYDQLCWLARWRLRACCRARRAGLLITTHGHTSWPTLIDLSCPLEAVQSLVARLLCAESSVISPADVSRCYAAQHGNVREVFFALYDLYEKRRRGPHTLPHLPDRLDTAP